MSVPVCECVRLFIYGLLFLFLSRPHFCFPIPVTAHCGDFHAHPPGVTRHGDCAGGHSAGAYLFASSAAVSVTVVLALQDLLDLGVGLALKGFKMPKSWPESMFSASTVFLCYLCDVRTSTAPVRLCGMYSCLWVLFVQLCTCAGAADNCMSSLCPFCRPARTWWSLTLMSWCP